MTKKQLVVIVLAALLPNACLAAGTSGGDFNWGTIIGSVIATGIFGLVIVIEQKKKGATDGKSALFKPINTSGFSKFFKNLAILISLFIVYILIAGAIFPDRVNRDIFKCGVYGCKESMSLVRFLFAVAITILTVFVYKRFFANAKKI